MSVLVDSSVLLDVMTQDPRWALGLRKSSPGTQNAIY
jgi:hypothetical protein